MNPQPLLPTQKRQEWPPHDVTGVHSVSDKDYQRNLCENYYEASEFGTPSPLARAIFFKQRLERYMEDLQNNVPESVFEENFAQWAQLLKGLYFGVITLRPVAVAELRELGKIVAAELPEGFPLNFLLFQDKVIGFAYPEIGFVPSIRLEHAVILALENELRKKDVEKASEFFVGWVHTFDSKDQQNILFYSLLYHLAGKWNPTAPKMLDMEREKLFDPGSKLVLTYDDKVDEVVASPEIPIYVGAPIICAQCNYQIGKKESSLEVRNPDDCRCPDCQAKQDWLKNYTEWIRYSETRACYLIYAFKSSPVHNPPLLNHITFEDDGVTIQTGKINLKVYGLVLSEEALKCTRLIFFRDGDSLTAPHLPIKGEYFGLVRIAKRDRNPFLDRVTGDYIVTLEIEGWNEQITIRYKGNEIEREEALLLSWPNFKLKGWNVYYYLLDSTPEMYRAGMALRALNLSGQPLLLTTTRGQLSQAVDAFEVVFAKNNKIERQSGIFMISRDEIQRGATPLTMALDFGTSSSTVFYRIGDGPIKVLRYTDFTDEVIPNKILSEKALTNSSWLPTYRLDDYQTALKFYRDQLDNKDSVPSGDKIIEKMNFYIPSEIIATSISAETLAHPLSGFRICHVYAARPEGEVIYSIKTMDAKGDPEARYTYQQVVTRYLEFFLVLSLATILQKERRAGYLIVRVSFPRTFDADKTKLYLECLDTVLQNIRELTGYEANAKYYIDETRAAAYSMPVQQSGLILMMDMGGGTTDIGVFERKKGKLEPIFLESMLYGGNNFLQLLAKRGELFPKPTEKQDNRLLWLFREIRLRSFATVVRTQYHGNDQGRQVALELLLHFYAPITYFVGRLFDALNLHRAGDKDYKKQDVIYYLVGNGWSLADAMAPIDARYSTGHKEILRYLLEKQGFTNLTAAANQPNFDDEDNLPLWPGPKAAVGVGMMKVPENLLYKSIEEASNVRNGIQSILGLDIQLNDGSNNFVQCSWDKKIPCPIESTLHKPALADLQIPAEWDFIEYKKGDEVSNLEQAYAKDIISVEKPVLIRSVLTRFIENIYLKQLAKARRI